MTETRMTADLFDKQFDLLAKEFPEANYSPQKQGMIFSAAKEYHYESFVKICNHFIATMRKPPIVQDFIDAFKQEPKAWSKEVPKEHTNECQKCIDSGLVQATTWDNVHMLARCGCRAGMELEEELPKLSDLGPGVSSEPPLLEWYKPNKFQGYSTILQLREEMEKRKKEAISVWKNYEVRATR